jgi:hypothetical protein
MLVSLYYSARYSHIAPGDAWNILNERRSLAERDAVDEYSLGRAVEYADRIVASPLTKVFRYEDVIYDKANWVADICDHFGWHVPAERQREIAAGGDVFPDKENYKKHIRQVHRGNYKKSWSRSRSARWTTFSRRIWPRSAMSPRLKRVAFAQRNAVCSLHITNDEGRMPLLRDRSTSEGLKG